MADEMQDETDTSLAPLHRSFPGVEGHCPACGGPSLFLGAGDHITCGRLDCPDPTLVDELLADREIEHIVQVDERTFTARHPLRERHNDALLRCDLYRHITSLSGPPVQPGRYRVRQANGGWTWEALPVGDR